MAIRPFHSLSLLCACLCGCVPIVDSYHSASASTGTVDVSCLKGELGPPSRVELDRGAVHLLVDGRYLSGVTGTGWSDSGTLVINFTVPRGHKAALDWNQVTFTDLTTGRTLPITYSDSAGVFDVTYQGESRFAGISRLSGVFGVYAQTSGSYHHTSFLGRMFGGIGRFDFHIGDALDPDSVPRIQEDASESDVAEYRLEFSFSNVATPARFDVHLPQIQVDGQTYPATDVRFQHTVGAFCVLLPLGLNAPPMRGNP